MQKELSVIFDEFIDSMKHSDGVLGAWNFGSVLHGLSDEYSDVDVVFLIEGDTFRHMVENLSLLLSEACDGILVCWEESFNGDEIINNGYLLKKDGRIFQFDVFLLNKSRIDDFMCKMHYTDLSEKDIIFDVDDNVKALCKDCPHGSFWDDNVDYLIDTYLYHFYMTVKYLARQDYFKLNHVMRTLYDTHVSLLLTGYDAINWGGAENKLHYLPSEKKGHLKKYYCAEDFVLNRVNLSQSIQWFQEDAEDVLARKKKEGGTEAIIAIKEYWKKQMEEI